MHKNLEGDTAGTDDPNWSKRYSIPYDVYKLGWKISQRAADQELARHQSGGGEQLHCASLGFVYSIIIIVVVVISLSLFSLSASLNCLYHNP